MNTLDDWLRYLEQLQPDRIELGLARISQVAVAAGLDKPAFKIVTVGGTNGKGSTVAYIAGLLRTQNLSVGVYTSPHFIDFNERIVVDDDRVTDEELCRAFTAIDTARGDTSLTYFEFTTLAGIHCFMHREVDVAVLEVGLGGRLDAVNAWDSDVACVTSVGIDHVDWLGDDREVIGYEKASIARRGCALVCGDRKPPVSIATTATGIGAELLQLGDDFTCTSESEGWQYSDAEITVSLPPPAIPGEWAIGNASVAICTTRQLLGRHLDSSELSAVLRQTGVAGRMQLSEHQGVPVILDVAHNVDAAALLAEYLQAHPGGGKTAAVFSCMQDKDISAILQAMQPCIDGGWYIAELPLPRAISSASLARSLDEVGVKSVDVFATVTTAFEQAVAQSATGDRVMVFGSFHVVGPVLSRLSETSH